MAVLGRNGEGRVVFAVDRILGRSASKEDGRDVAEFRPQGRQALGRSSVDVDSRREEHDDDFYSRSAGPWITALGKAVSLTVPNSSTLTPCSTSRILTTVRANVQFSRVSDYP